MFVYAICNRGGSIRLSLFYNTDRPIAEQYTHSRRHDGWIAVELLKAQITQTVWM